MFKTVYSRILTITLALVTGSLIALGIAVSVSFRSFYLKETEQRLLREVDDINEITVDRYLDINKRPTAREELSSIARLYDACIQLCFDEQELGRYSAYASPERWGVADEADLAPYIEAVRSGEYGSCSYGVLNRYTGFQTLTAMRPIESEGRRLGVIFLHYDMTGVNRSIGAALRKVALFSAAAILLSIPLVMIPVHSVTKPISHMTEVVRSYSKGDLSRRVDMNGTDEVANLGRTFNAMADELNTLEAARRSFVANVSHELRSPLTSMRGFIEAMADGTVPPEEYGPCLEIVLEENRRMTRMVNDLLDLARIESGQYKLNLTVFDVNELIRRTSLTFETRILQKHFHVDFLLSDEPVYVEADRERITQVLHNLIDNAIKYAPQGGYIRIESHEEKHLARIAVTNSGKDIPEEALAHLFDRFYKAEKAHTRSEVSGTGLGLSIAKLIIDQHKQSITVSSKDGATTFQFTLALAKYTPKKETKEAE
ncbi:MAG: HAMP domain-containing protein [Clostridia bacterium]|nr:HAMP domain-containing protein [Clostridia bacterium]